MRSFIHNLYASPNISSCIKSGRLERVRHDTFKAEMRNAYGILVGIPEGRRETAWKTIILEWML